MHRPRSFSSSAHRAMLLTLVALCAGCWEKIEYTGPRTTSTAPRNSPPADTAKPADGQPAVVSDAGSVPETPTVVAERAEPTSSPLPDPPAIPPAEPVAGPSKPDDDRYAKA